MMGMMYWAPYYHTEIELRRAIPIQAYSNNLIQKLDKKALGKFVSSELYIHVEHCILYLYNAVYYRYCNYRTEPRLFWDP